MQDGPDASGLQTLAPDGSWIDVNPPRGAIVLNVGEILQAITGNYCIACIHRVITSKPRFSSAYFHGPDLRTQIVPINIPKHFHDAVKSSARHANAKFMSKRQDLLEGKDVVASSCALNYGEQLWNYLARSYPESLKHHYPDYV